MERLETLNPSQREAVLHDTGPLVIYAGAGSGKTRVITQRVAELIRRGVAPYQILAVTFTNKAAREMRERLGRELSGAEQQTWIGTFHAMCAKLLRMHAKQIGISPSFTIYDDHDQRAMISRILRDLHIGDRLLSAKTAAWRINRAKQEGRGPDAIATDSVIDELVQKAYRLYEERMDRAQALDFDDLIYRLVRAADQNAELKHELASRFKYVLVDEFQDTNRIQFRLVALLVSEHGNLCVVGDDDQSIYRWRGADYRNMLDFRERFPDAITLKLEQNYRSTQSILEAAHAVIRQNTKREPKKLWTQNAYGEHVRVCPCADEHDEAHSIARQVKLLCEQDYALSDMAVFYRIHAQSRVLEEALRSHNIPYRIIGGTRFYDRAEVKDLLAYLRVIRNPEDDVSLLRIINVPTRGIGKTTIEQILNEAAKNGQGVWTTIQGLLQNQAFASAAQKKLHAFCSLIGGLRELLAADTKASELAQAVLERTGYLANLQTEDTAEADARMQNLRELIGSIMELERQDNTATLDSFLETVTLDEVGKGEHEGQSTLSLMTVHAAKGLEFPIVFVSGLEERLFPFRGVDSLDELDDLEEERRLAYVALTRAKEHLWLSYAVTRRIFGQLKVCEPSRFVDALPNEIVELCPSPALSRAQKRVQPTPTFFQSIAKERSSTISESHIEPVHDDISWEDGVAVRKGMRVRHKSFGEGRIAALSLGSPPRATVRFQSGDTKQVLLSYLEPG